MTLRRKKSHKTNFIYTLRLWIIIRLTLGTLTHQYTYIYIAIYRMTNSIHSQYTLLYPAYNYITHLYVTAHVFRRLQTIDDYVTHLLTSLRLVVTGITFWLRESAVVMTTLSARSAPAHYALRCQHAGWPTQVEIRHSSANKICTHIRH